MKTTVRNLLTGETELFINEYSPVENLVNSVICNRKQTSQLLNKDFRNRLKLSLKIVEKISANGDNIAFCEPLNLFARQTLTNS